jgi:hydrogenase expression/formation protein HypC
MCWAIPVKIKEIDGQMGQVEMSGTERQVGLQMIEQPRVGDYVLVHAGFAIQKIDEEEARETLRLWDEMARAAQNENEIH